MDFAFTSEQEELRAQARAYLDDASRALVARAGRARLDRRLGTRRGRWRGPGLPRGGGAVRGDGPRTHPCALLVDDRRHAARAPGRPSGRGGPGRGELDTRERPARRRPRHGHADRLRRRRLDLGAGRCRSRGAAHERRDPAARRRVGRRRGTPPGGLGAPAAPSRAVADRSRARGLRRRPAGPRPHGRVREGAQAVRKGDRHLPGDLAPTRDDPDGARARPVARALRRLVHLRGRHARADRGRGSEVSLRGGRGGRLRARNPGARWDRIHLGARSPPALQAVARHPRLGASGAQLRAEIADHLLEGEDTG